MVEAIILFSHGSVLCGAGETLEALAERLRGRDAAIVEIGYLNYSTPTFATAVERCVAAGVRRIVVAPYFLVPGKFVTVDLPRSIAAVRERFPDVEVIVAEPFRDHPALAHAILACAERAVPAATSFRSVMAITSACRLEPRCPFYGKPGCRAAAQVGA